MGTRRPREIVPRPDGDPLKRFPNGLKACLKSIRKYWPGDIRPGPGRKVGPFANKFRATYNKVARYYGHKAVTDGGLSRIISRLEGSGNAENYDINFAKMRAYALYTGLPTSLLILYSQAVSYEAQGRGPDHILDFIRRCRFAVSTLEDLVQAAPDGEQVFHHRKAGAAGYLARLKALSEMAKAFNTPEPFYSPR